MDGADPAEFAPRGDRYDAQRICLGQALCTKLADLRLFMVGAGAIGCELLKNFALLGVATTAGKGQIIVTDNDVIETSNLSRQFLFRSTDVQSSKAETAARAAVAMNPDLNVEARLERVGEETENIFSDEFIQVRVCVPCACAACRVCHVCVCAVCVCRVPCVPCVCVCRVCVFVC